MLSTRLTDAFDLETPIAQAGMAFAGMSPPLAAAISSAGGLGSLAIGAAPPELVAGFAAMFGDAAPGMPLNLNFITIFTTDEHIDALCEAKPRVASFHWGSPKPEWVARMKSAGISVWEQVGTVDDAIAAVDNGAEVVIAQGTEAGGHNYATLPTFAFTPAVVDAVGDRAMVLASGGVTDGRTLAAALALGADGAWVGSRFVATHESSAAAEYKDRVVASGGSDTVKTSMFGPDLPPGFNPMRVLRNRIVAEHEHDDATWPTELDTDDVVGSMDLLGQPMDLHRFGAFVPMAGATGDFDQLPLLAGEGIGAVNGIVGAADVVREMTETAAGILKQRVR